MPVKIVTPPPGLRWEMEAWGGAARRVIPLPIGGESV
jgi:hypothetical protein